MPGDVIYAINGERIYLKSDVSLIMGLGDTGTIDMTVLRGGEKLDRTLTKQTYTDENGQEYEAYGFSDGGGRDESAEPIPRPSRPIRAGDLVEIPGTKRQAEVTAVKGDVLALRAGALQMKVKADEVRLIEDDERAAAKKKTPQFAPSQRILHAAAAARELDIRGMETLEAESVLASYIDSAVLAHLETVTIIHGKGTGALKEEIRRYLRTVPEVERAADEHADRGGAGITVVTLRMD